MYDAATKAKTHRHLDQHGLRITGVDGVGDVDSGENGDDAKARRS